MIGKLANALGYQAVWFTSVAGASHGLPWAGPLAASAFAAMVLGFGGQRRADLRLLLPALAIGAIADSAWIAFGWLDYNASWPSPAFAPVWILGIWFAFALTLNHSLAFLKRRLVLATMLGAIGGPFAYWGASQSDAVHFDAPAWTVLGGLCLGWALICPWLMSIAERRSTDAVPVRSTSREAHP